MWSSVNTHTLLLICVCVGGTKSQTTDEGEDKQILQVSADKDSFTVVVLTEKLEQTSTHALLHAFTRDSFYRIK